MARIDKTDSAIGVVRAALNADIEEANYDKVKAVGINAQGRIVYGAGQTGVIGVIISDKTVRKAGKIADIFVLGDILENTGLSAGTKYYADPATGDLTTDAAAGANAYVGFTVEADRLILRGF